MDSNNHHSISCSNATTTINNENSSPKRPPPAEPTQFRILCPSVRTGAVIGKGGSTVRHIQSITGAKVRLLDDPHVPPCEDRVILISNPNPNPNPKRPHLPQEQEVQEEHPNDAVLDEITNPEGGVEGEEGKWGPVWKGIVRVFEKIVKGDSEEDLGEDVVVYGKFLVGAGQVGSVLGKGGKVLEKVRVQCGAHQVRVLPRDQIPLCACHGDELIVITGSFEAVKRGLLSISTFLHDDPWTEAANTGVTKPSGVPAHHPADYQSRGYVGPRSMGAHNRRIFEEEVVFKLLCPSDKVGSLIGKGGSVVRALENESGASIKMAEAIPDSDERVVVIAARENAEQRHSPAQDAVLCVHAKLTEIGFDRGSAVAARLLVHPHQIGRLLGKGGQNISEMRQITGAGIRIYPKEQAPKYGSQNDEIVQVVGSFQCVQDALFRITSRLREIIFPIRRPISSPNFPSAFPEMHPSQFRAGPNPGSPSAYHSSVGPFHTVDHSGVPSHPLDHQHTFSYGMDHFGPPNLDRGPFPYGCERPGHGPPFENSPRSWAPQPFSDGNSRLGADPGFSSRSANLESGNQGPGLASAPVEVVVPYKFLSHVYGENSGNLTQIRQISGANVSVHDAKLGASEGVVVLSGTADQIHTAQMLLHAFILCGETTSC